ncbi:MULTISPECIES: tRNA (guanosine(46)-N7)-methyltransferase TrmB [Weeksella]|uniref:tRNA (guanosine(46)-N7)-methyltransferase TrmB n=1 Tax=Weeksella TaxID=1013 RepID=UPI0008A367E5|nr:MULTISPECIES: tRNA (guanosine(46)-N7)-methyltransferase TrmB [Weeksella]MDK7374267.1 tRNA (guanosine(46)-N7)-methyltransferase TrmB [Weeksella virosa]MDK7674570.1 tRNA (guanosine(46)-N7)-methyltransferase TrmB [Weeksella virosa]OFM86124.1 tRNA (guanine(46)-N(7))-methyltransferase [Weeksella sp. HMSC059D05]SUP54269.1 tRNA (guanine-N(7)-)-methyltransferase [Weeksella virosa]
MGKDKIRRFEENKTFKHVVQPTRDEVINDFSLKGKWRQEFFKNDHPIVLELGCGKGEYTIAMSRREPNKNFIGIDIKGARFWRGAKTAKDENLQNVGFVRTQIELIDYLFDKGEVNEIWITFPDPQIKFRRTKHRLTHPSFLAKYASILTKDGTVNLKTDSEFLHGYTHGILQAEGHKVLQSSHDVYHPDHADIPPIVTEVQTFYESKFLEENKKITYIRFQLTH